MAIELHSNNYHHWPHKGGGISVITKIKSYQVDSN